MRILSLVTILIFIVQQISCASDIEVASNARFKAEYVEPEKTQRLSDLPVFYSERDKAIGEEHAAIQKGATPEELDRLRRAYLRIALYQIRVTDQVTGLIYEVQTDRRTVTARKPDGKILWKVNPFEDAKMEPYRFKYPFITHMGKMETRAINGPVLIIGFNSSQYGPIELDTGNFHFWGQD